MTETKTNNPKTVERQVQAVFATHTAVEKNALGQDALVSRTAWRGEKATFTEDEAKRLDSLGALVPSGSEASTDEIVRRALERAVNPADNVGTQPSPGVGPVTVSPPAGGAEPLGTYVTGDTGAPDTPAPAAAATGAPSPTTPALADPTDLASAEAWLREAKPTAPEVVKAAGTDPAAAETLLEAENIVRGGDPRKTVEEPLRAVIDGEGRNPDGQ